MCSKCSTTSSSVTSLSCVLWCQAILRKFALPTGLCGLREQSRITPLMLLVERVIRDRPATPTTYPSRWAVRVYCWATLWKEPTSPKQVFFDFHTQESGYIHICHMIIFRKTYRYRQVTTKTIKYAVNNAATLIYIPFLVHIEKVYEITLEL